MRRLAIATAAAVLLATPVPAHAATSRRHHVDVWADLAHCESTHRNVRSTRYSGYFQFSTRTWRSLGYHGYAHQHSYEVQRQAAIRLQQRSGWGQWPACSRKLGLR